MAEAAASAASHRGDVPADPQLLKNPGYWVKCFENWPRASGKYVAVTFEQHKFLFPSARLPENGPRLFPSHPPSLKQRAS